jgi:hypothetical protein
LVPSAAVSHTSCRHNRENKTPSVLSPAALRCKAPAPTHKILCRDEPLEQVRLCCCGWLYFCCCGGCRRPLVIITTLRAARSRHRQ